MDIETEDQRVLDRLKKIIPNKETGKSKTRCASLDTIKSAYISEGLTAEEMCERFAMSPDKALELISKNSLDQLRNAYRKEGLRAVQEVQIDQAQRMVEIETQFKRLKLIQLESKLKDYLAYYVRHGDLVKRHPQTDEPLLDQNNIPMQLNVPSVMREIGELKASMELTHGMKSILVSLEDIIQPPTPILPENETIVDVNEIDKLFERKG